MKKIILLFVLVLLVIGISSYTFAHYLIMSPAVAYENDVYAIYQNFLQKNNLIAGDYINRYAGNKIYYVAAAYQSRNQHHIYVFLENGTIVTSLKEEIDFDAFKSKLKTERGIDKVSNNEIALGYENNRIVYVYTNIEKSTLRYIYYYFDTQIYMKSYILEK